ncbi:MAG: MlaD family protein [Pseudomonadota bacterium]
MKRERLNYVMVGSFVAMMALALLVTLFLVTGRSTSTDTYHVVYDNVSGVKFGTAVHYEGYPIGQVTEVVPIQDKAVTRFRVELEVNEGWEIAGGSIAKLQASGLLSAKLIEISAGVGPAMAPGSQLMGRSSNDIFSAVNQVASSIEPIAQNLERSLVLMLDDLRQVTSQSIRPLFDEIRRSLGDEAVLQNIRSLVANAETTTAQVAKLLSDDTVGSLQAGTDNLAKLLGELRESNRAIRSILDEETQTRVRASVAALDSLMIGLGESNRMLQSMIGAPNQTQIANALRALAATAASFEKTAKSSEQLLDESTVRDAQRAIQEFAELGRGLNQTNQKLGAVLSPETAVALTDLVDGANQTMGRLAGVSASLQKMVGDGNRAKVEELLGKLVTLTETLSTTSTRIGSTIDDAMVAGVKSAVSSTGALMADLRSSSAQLRAILSDANQTAIRDTLSGSADLVSGLNDTNAALQSFLDPESQTLAKQTLREFSSVAGNLGEASVALRSALGGKNGEHLSTLLAESAGASAQAKRLLSRLNRTGARLDKLMANLDSVVGKNEDDLGVSVKAIRRVVDVLAQHIDSVVYHLDGSSRNVYEFTRQIRENPALLVTGAPQANREGLRQ